MLDLLKKHDVYSSAMRNLLLNSINSMGDCLALFDDSFMVVYTNKAAENIFGFKIGDYCCDKYLSTKVHEDSCHLLQTITKKAEYRIIEEIPISFVKDWEKYIPEGEENVCEMTFESIYTPLFVKDSSFWGCVKLSRNLTLNRCLQNKLKKVIIDYSRKFGENEEKLEKFMKTNQEVQDQLIQSEKLASLGKISSGISHEMYNSLSVLGPKIKLFGVYLDKIIRVLDEYDKLRDLECPPEVREILDRISKFENSDREISFYKDKLQKFIAPCTSELYSIEKIVEGLNEFTNLQKSDFRYVNLNDELENTLILLEYEFSNNDILVIKRYDSTLVDIPCYPADLNQVILNILTNSIEALREKKSRTDNNYEPIIKINTKKEGDEAILIFYDNGCGFPEEIYSNIFDPFFTTKSPTSNAGLGLSTVRSIIEKKHRGKILIKSEVGENAEFTIKFPVTQNFPS